MRQRAMRMERTSTKTRAPYRAMTKTWLDTRTVGLSPVLPFSVALLATVVVVVGGLSVVVGRFLFGRDVLVEVCPDDAVEVAVEVVDEVVLLTGTVGVVV
jgi:hypothetical protein